MAGHRPALLGINPDPLTTDGTDFTDNSTDLPAAFIRAHPCNPWLKNPRVVGCGCAAVGDSRAKWKPVSLRLRVRFLWLVWPRRGKRGVAYSNHSHACACAPNSLRSRVAFAPLSWPPRLPVSCRLRRSAPHWRIPRRGRRCRSSRSIPAARPDELTPAASISHEPFARWTRSQGDNGARRYSTLKQITKENVRDLQVAWTYRSGDGAANIQCTPIIVDGLLYAPTPGRAIVAVDAATGSNAGERRWSRRDNFVRRMRRRDGDWSTGLAIGRTRPAFSLARATGYTPWIRKQVNHCPDSARKVAHRFPRGPRRRARYFSTSSSRPV